MRNDSWLDDNEYPDERDMEAFGDDSPVDYDPLTIGYVGDSRPGFWTPQRIAFLIGVLILLGALLLPLLFRLFS